MVAPGGKALRDADTRGAIRGPATADLARTACTTGCRCVAGLAGRAVAAPGKGAWRARTAGRAAQGIGRSGLACPPVVGIAAAARAGVGGRACRAGLTNADRGGVGASLTSGTPFAAVGVAGAEPANSLRRTAARRAALRVADALVVDAALALGARHADRIDAWTVCATGPARAGHGAATRWGDDETRAARTDGRGAPAGNLATGLRPGSRPGSRSRAMTVSPPTAAPVLARDRLGP
jgi:hypothetical protein